jgi:hypothetical protein
MTDVLPSLAAGLPGQFLPLPELIRFSSINRLSLKGFLKDVSDSDFRRHFLELMVLYSLL